MRCSRHGCARSLTPFTGGDSSASLTGSAGYGASAPTGSDLRKRWGRRAVTRPTPEGYRSAVLPVRRVPVPDHGAVAGPEIVGESASSRALQGVSALVRDAPRRWGPNR